MATPDLNLLVTLDVLLAECSVARAGRRLRLSPSAMSRALARLRETTGDPLLVRAGRGLVPTPRALELREQVSHLVQGAEAVLRPAENLNLKQLVRTFTLRTSEGFVENFGANLVRRVGEDAPGVCLAFLTKADKDSTPLREGRVDLETGVIEGSLGPEVRTQGLFRDRLIGVVRSGHPLTKGQVTASRYSEERHVVISRSGFHEDAVELPFLPQGLKRRVGAVVSGFSAAISLARASDLVATVPEQHTGNLRDGMFSFTLPLQAQAFTVSMLWHPRQDADGGHRWLRARLRDVCAPGSPSDAAMP